MVHRQLRNRALVCLALLIVPTLAPGQESPLPEQRRLALLDKRDLKAQRARTAVKKGEFDHAQKLLDEVFEIEHSLFGGAHEDRLGTLRWQARIATDAKAWKDAVAYCRRAREMGQTLYDQQDYHLRDLELELTEARENANRTDKERQQLSQASAAFRRASTLQRQGQYEQAITLVRRAKTLRGRVLGKDHPSYANSVNFLGNLLWAMGDYTRAEPLQLEAKAIRQSVLGEMHPSYAASLNDLAALYRHRGDYARAEPLYLQSKAIYAKTLGKQHRRYALSLNNLAALYEAMGDYSQSASLYRDALTNLKESRGTEHPEYTFSLGNLALVYQKMGDFAQSESLLLEAKSIQEKILGKEHPWYAASLARLSLVYDRMGKYRLALQFLVEAQAIQEKSLGKEHPDYATTLDNLAAINERIGDYDQAESLYVRAKAIRERRFGKAHPQYAQSLNNLAVFYSGAGNYSRAKPIQTQAIAIWEKTLGKEHPRYAAAISNLAHLNQAMAQYGDAETRLIEAKAILEKTLGDEHPSYAQCLGNLGVLYARMGDIPRAESLLVKAKRLRERLLGKTHPDYASTLNNLAGLYQTKADYARAEPLYLEAIDITLRQLESVAYLQSEQQQLLMSQKIRYQLDNYLQCCLDGDLPPEGAIERLVTWKGAVLRRSRGLRLAATNPEVAERLRQLQSVASQISTIAQSVPETNQWETWRNRLETLTEEQRTLEADLIRRSTAFRESARKITLDDIRQAIPEDSVLVDYLEFGGNDGRSLLASVIPHDGKLRLIELGSAETAGKAIDAWRESFGIGLEGKATGAELREQLWEPLLESIQDAELILVSTDGVLGRLPLAALPGRQPGSYLIEEHRLALIPVPQLLPALVAEQEVPRLSCELLLFGDVDYGATTVAGTHTSPEQPRKRKRLWERSEVPSEVRGGLRWSGLDETRAEVEFIAGLYKRLYQPEDEAVLDLRKSRATESAFIEYAPQSMFIHLATHGFFSAPEVRSAMSGESVAAQGRERIFRDQREAISGYLPGQLSGLVFAGANHAKNVDPTTEERTQDDGILTADEIAYLPLGGTRLVVLSACETGLGEVAGGEGLLGIQRAFQVAGSRSTIATLWKVNDAATRRMMQEFYTNYLDKEMSALDSLQQAQLWALNHPDDLPRGQLRPVKNSGESSPPRRRLSPQFWAPYVLSGDWR